MSVAWRAGCSRCRRAGQEKRYEAVTSRRLLARDVCCLAVPSGAQGLVYLSNGAGRPEHRRWVVVVGLCSSAFKVINGKRASARMLWRCGTSSQERARGRLAGARLAVIGPLWISRFSGSPLCEIARKRTFHLAGTWQACSLGCLASSELFHYGILH